MVDPAVQSETIVSPMKYRGVSDGFVRARHTSCGEQRM